METFKYSNIGSREVNQDYVISKSFGQDMSLHLVADGIGGYQCGEIASKIVGDSIASAIKEGKRIEEAISSASSALKKDRANLGISKMGCTVAGVLLKNHEAQVFWAGDSRIYVFRNQETLFQSVDHSMVNELQKIRNLTFDEKIKYGHIITRSIMGNEDDRVDKFNILLQENDEILICTDGVYNDCPIDYLVESIRNNNFDIDKQNENFEDNHSLIYIRI